MNEIGLDPGIDHCSAMSLVDSLRAQGKEVVSFTSFCGGLPAPEDADVPLGYKFSWSPKGVLTAASNSALFKLYGEVRCTLFKRIVRNDDLLCGRLARLTATIYFARTSPTSLFPTLSSLKDLQIGTACRTQTSMGSNLWRAFVPSSGEPCVTRVSRISCMRSRGLAYSKDQQPSTPMIGTPLSVRHLNRSWALLS